VNYLTVNGECIEKSCDEADISSAVTYAIYICSLYGVAITSYFTFPTTSVSTSAAAAATTVTDITSVTVASVATTIQVTNSPATATAGANSQSGESSTPTSAIPTSQGSETPIGPIVGGVVGGVAVLCLIVGAIYFFFIRPRNPGKQKDHEQVPTQDHAEKRDEPVDPDPVQAPPVDPTTAPLDDILSGRVRYTDPDRFAAPQDHQDGEDLPSGRLQYPNVE